MSCSQLIEIEDLVLGTTTPARARELRAHVEGCTACRLEQAAVTKERALFTHREAAVAPPSDALAAALRAALTAEAEKPARARASITGSHVGPARRGATRLVHRGASALGRVLRRGHVSAACAAVLFALVAFSKLGGAPILPAAGEEGTSSEADGPTGSLFSQYRADETLVCSPSGSMMTFSSDQVVSSGATTQSSSSGATMREVLACSPSRNGSGASCEPSVTCSSLRQ